ncbi:MAG: Ig-like domain-containing protein [Gemmatimonadales bacterium]
MRRWLRLLPLAVVLGCSSLEEGEAGIVALEVSFPAPAIVEVGETLQFSARPLDKNGDSVAAEVAWRTPDATITVDPVTGLVTGVSPGTGRVQAVSGSLTSDFVTLSVIAPADTVIIVGDSIFTVPAGPTSAPALVTRLESLAPAGPLATRPVIYRIISPDPTTPPLAVELSDGTQADTVLTATDGTVSTVTVRRTAGGTAPVTAIVEVSARRTRGAAVPGSGQRFTVSFE